MESPERAQEGTCVRLVWAGSNQTVDILLDITNPGLWMAHCHIAEHSQSGMMFSFPVTEEAGR